MRDVKWIELLVSQIEESQDVGVVLIASAKTDGYCKDIETRKQSQRFFKNGNTIFCFDIHVYL